MKSVTLKRIRLVNFKGIKDLSVPFSDRTTISGANGRGKTTIFDGFTWVLFGKNSKDEAEFGIKTVDANMQPIPRLPHEVEVVLDVNDDEVTLTRRYNEVWRRDKDSNGEERMQGHEVERLYNGVPCSVKDWNEKIAEIIKEDIFKYTTNPHYFSAQKPETQRALLFKMAGGVTDAEIIASDPQFVELFAKVGNKTLKQFEDETKSALTRVRKELSDLPARIDERKRDEVAAEDWAALEREIAERTAELQSVEDAIADKAKAITAASEARAELARKVAHKKRERSEQEQALAAHRASERTSIVSDKMNAETLLKKDRNLRATAESTIANLQDRLKRFAEDREELLEQRKKINAETISFNESDITCPTCGREYDADYAKEKLDKMAERFNANKAKKLEENTQWGLRIKQSIEETKQSINEEKDKIAAINGEIAVLEEKVKEYDTALKSFDEVDVIPKGYFDAIDAEIAELQASLDAAPTELADTELQSKKRTLTAELDSLKARLAKREQIKANAERIKELEVALASNGNEETRLKGLLYAIKEFSKARSRAISDRVNGLFRYVKFKLFDTQVNGEEVEVCEATYNGVSYGNLSTGQKVVVGLDIIRTIQRHTGVSAPIFIENAESITDYPDNVLDDFKQIIWLKAVVGLELTVE